jgi:hypothetical protein
MDRIESHRQWFRRKNGTQHHSTPGDFRRNNFDDIPHRVVHIERTEVSHALVVQQVTQRGMISISRAGSMRSLVIVVGRFALKFAQNARGRASNLYEVKLYRSVNPPATALLSRYAPRRSGP